MHPPSDDRLLYFPVRHHSPAAARLVAAAIRELTPDAVLIEGPSDFNDRIDQLRLEHRPPIAIYSWMVGEDGLRRGAYYPFCVYSPEWQAAQVGFEVGAEVAFIDLPWADMAAQPGLTDHRYSDAELKRSRYVETLCQRLEVEDFDAAWDRLIEIETLDLADYLERCGELCAHLRHFSEVSAADRQRETFMAGRILGTLARTTGPVVVVTGGFHTPALRRLVAAAVEVEPAARPALGEGRGIALTPYSYESLDSLTGYESGMPSPGFYHRLWLDRGDGPDRGEREPSQTWRHLLFAVAEELRRRDHPVSSADLIAVETTARGLAAIRGHAEPWRRDLIDAITGALIKDETGAGGSHPLLETTYRVLRGGERGRLAAGTALPALVRELQRRLAELDLEPGTEPRRLELDLFDDGDLDKSRLLHATRILAIRSFQLLEAPDLIRRDDLSQLHETWVLEIHRDFEASAIAAAAYGPTVCEAVAARLLEHSAQIERDAEAAAGLLIDAALAGIHHLSGLLFGRLNQLLIEDASFARLTRALGHLLYLYRYDPVLRTTGRQDLAELVRLAVEWALIRLEGLGQTDDEKAAIQGVTGLVEAYERCGDELDLSLEALLDALARIVDDDGQRPSLRGAALGALWTLGEADDQRLLGELARFARPQELGDFLAGLFQLAREAVQRRPELLTRVDQLILGYDDVEFLNALPALRLAFTRFTPREKHYLIRTLLEATDDPGREHPNAVADIEYLPVAPEAAARTLALEAELARRLTLYGLRDHLDVERPEGDEP